MKKLFTLLLIVCTLASFAQPTVTSAVMGNIGEVLTFTNVNADGFDVGPAGNNVTWDFSDITTIGSPFDYEIVNVASTPYAADFPGSNMAIDGGTGSYTYFKLLATEYSNYGAGTAAAIVYYSDPEKIFEFPLSVGASHTDDFYSEFTSGIEFIRSGSVTTTTDAWGTLKLPSGDYTSVVRVKVEEDYQDDADLLPTPIIYNFDIYYWFKNGVDGPLFTYFHMETTTGGSPFVSESANVNNNIFVNGIEGFTTENMIRVYPNPCDELVTIQADGMNQVELYNTVGALIYQQAGITTDAVNMQVNNLPAGMYFIKVTTADGVAGSTVQIL